MRVEPVERMHWKRGGNWGAPEPELLRQAVSDGLKKRTLLTLPRNTVARCLCWTTLAAMVWMTKDASGQEELPFWAPGLGSFREFRLTPEYEDTLEKLILFFDPRNKPAVQTQVNLLRVLPDYTRVKMVVMSGGDEELLREAVPEGVHKRIEFIQPANPNYLVWAQDSCKGDSRVKLLPWDHGTEWLAPGQQACFGEEVRRVPLLFHGGNVLHTRDGDGRTVLFIGANDYVRTVGLYAGLNVDLSMDAFKEIVMGAFCVERVEVLATSMAEYGPLQDPPLMHIDQIILPVDDGVMAVLTVDATSPHYRVLSKYREQVEAAGFRAVPIATNDYRLEKQQSYVNAIVFTNKDTGRRTVIMPIFPDQAGRYEIIELNLAARKAFESIGLDVKVVCDHVYAGGGNLHCLSLR